VKRLLFKVLAGVSLVMFIATVGLWMDSYHHGVGFEGKSPNRFLLFGTIYGGFQYLRIDEDITSDYSTPGWFCSNPYPPIVVRTYGGFGIDNFGNFRCLAVDIPAYPAAVLFGIFPGLKLHRRVRQQPQARRSREQRCPACRYDLRATPQRCPECGTAPAKKSG
jgi:hypothetical protein